MGPVLHRAVITVIDQSHKVFAVVFAATGPALSRVHSDIGPVIAHGKSFSHDVVQQIIQGLRTLSSTLFDEEPCEQVLSHSAFDILLAI